MGLLASTHRPANPVSTNVAAQAVKTVFQGFASDLFSRIAANTGGAMAAPILPHMLPQPRIAPTCLPPTSCMKAHTALVPRSTKKNTAEKAIVAGHGESIHRHDRYAAAAPNRV